jgi:hypothetical protein
MGGTYRLYLQGRKRSQTRNHCEAGNSVLFATFITSGVRTSNPTNTMVWYTEELKKVKEWEEARKPRT